MSVFIQIDEKAAITSDNYCWRLSVPKMRKNEETGESEPGWTAVRYYNSLDNLVQKEVDQRLRESDASTLAELLEMQSRVFTLFSQALTGMGFMVDVSWKGRKPTIDGIH